MFFFISLFLNILAISFLPFSIEVKVLLLGDSLPLHMWRDYNLRDKILSNIPSHIITLHNITLHLIADNGMVLTWTYNNRFNLSLSLNPDIVVYYANSDLDHPLDKDKYITTLDTMAKTYAERNITFIIG